MLNRIKVYGLSIVIAFFSIIFISQVSSAQPYSCIPTCDGNDGKNLVFAGTGNASLTNNETTFLIRSSAGSPTMEFGIFDGDDGTDPNSFWDLFTSPITATLFTDSNGDGVGEIEIGQWEGDDMPDNDWFAITVPNSQNAETEDGDFRYILRVEANNEANQSLNSYKVRVDGSLALFPETQAFSIIVRAGTQGNFELLYPNANFNDPSCFDPIANDTTCAFGDPGCCLNPSTYDGNWKFCFNFEGDEDVLNVWDGDFDFGSASFDNQGICQAPDGIALDTDDPNTPPGIPSFAIGTEAVPQGVSVPTLPPDDNECFNTVLRRPSITYALTSPSGQSYQNVNPSGNKEWELFNLSTLPFDPALYDIEVSELESGIWCMDISGLDMLNLNAIRFDVPVLGLDEEDDPVPFDPPDPASVPTLNEWGLISLSVFVLLISAYYLRFSKKIYVRK
ncbi:MAG: hypothetical protein DHS20C13_07070 [Thermodesulfobacteriota bacterium]|nr:MAG: hypothetical protein DHS20C13_07070 [Thermodesulfobacteriota bacterium]